MQKTLHIKLKQINGDIAKLRCFTDNPNDFTSRDLNLSDITQLIKDAEAGYYTALPKALEQMGRQLYSWLDGAERFLDRTIKDCLPAEVVALAIETQGGLAHLPWEVMHNGNMCCGIVDDVLMARVGPDSYDDALSRDHAREMNFTGKPMKGFVYVDPAGFAEDWQLREWIAICEAFTASLAAK